MRTLQKLAPTRALVSQIWEEKFNSWIEVQEHSDHWKELKQRPSLRNTGVSKQVPVAGGILSSWGPWMPPVSL